MSHHIFFCKKCSKQLYIVRVYDEGFSTTTGSKCVLEKHQCPEVSRISWFGKIFTAHSTVFARFKGDTLIGWWRE